MTWRQSDGGVNAELEPAGTVSCIGELTLALIHPHAGRKFRDEMASHPKISHYLHKSLLT